MKHIFSLLFVLLFCFAAHASTCPADKPLQDIKGNCYSCDEQSVITINEATLGKRCHEICPNRWVKNSGFSTGTEEPCEMYTSLKEYYLEQEWYKNQLKTPYGRFKYFYLSSFLFYLNALLFFFIFKDIIHYVCQKKCIKNHTFISIPICITLALLLSILTIEFHFSLLFSLSIFLFYNIFKMIGKEGKPALIRILIVCLIFFLLYGLPGLIHTLFFK